jgi:filamentous hemagglutinin
MALATSNVNTVTDSFQNWIDKTNILLDGYSTTIVTTAANSQGGTTTGNGTVNGIFTANSVTVNGNTTFGLRGGNTTIANVLYVTSNVSIGNTTVNTVFTTTTIDTDLALTVLGATTLSNSLSVTGNTTLTGNATLNGTLQTISGNATFDSGVLFVDATNNRVGINNTAPGVALRLTGDIDVSATANIQGNANVGGIFGVFGNTTLSGTLQTISGNSTFNSGTLFVDATNNRVGINNTAPGVALRVTGAADISLTANVQGAANVGGSLGVAGNTTLTGNATLSGTLQTISGNVNIDSGVLFVDATNNRVGINNTTPTVALEVLGAANVTTSVNSALLTVGSSFIANATGAYHTGVINAASHTTTGFVANTTAIAPTSNTISLGNTIGRFVLSANTGDFSGNVVISGAANVGSVLRVTGNVVVNTFVTYLTMANTDMGSNTTVACTAVSFPKASYQAGELLVYTSKGVEYQITKILFAHNGTDVNQTIYGTIVAPSSSTELANNIVLAVNGANIDISLKQRAINSSVKILANMII